MSQDQLLRELEELEELLGPIDSAAAFLHLEMTYPDSGGRRSKAAARYHETVEDEFLALADGVTVGRGVSSADEYTADGATFWREGFCLHAATAAALKPVADRAIEMVRAAGIRPGYTFTLRLRSTTADGTPEERVRPVSATTRTRWRLVRPKLRLPPAKRPPAGYPERLAYLAVWAERCHAVGGNDIWGVFGHEPDLRAFLAGLSAADRAGFIDLYKQIVRRRDNEWVHAWYQQNEIDNPADWPRWPDKVTWLFAVLDRLREGGLLAGVRGKVRRTVLLYWDDYGYGEPHLADEG